MMNKITLLSRFLFFFFILTFAINTQADNVDVLKRLELAYPDSIKEVSSNYIAWKDGSLMRVRSSFPLANLFAEIIYNFDPKVGSISRQDILRDSYEPFFRKMYGNSAAEVKKKLATIYWMPKVFGTKYPLRVTTVNGVDKKLRRISAELEKLPPSYHKFLANPAGGFYWRNVAHETYLSAHSFGIAIDINSSYGSYWLWDWQKVKRKISKRDCHNRIPMKIVEIFEKEGFYWGGRWDTYDTMHFEYRPELFIA